MSKFEKIFTEGFNTTKDEEKLFDEFVKGLEKLTKKTGWGVESTGGVSFDDPKTIKKVTYSNDPTSGDIDYEIINK